MIKNTAGQKVGRQMVSATDGSAFTGTVTVYVTGDAGTQAIGSVGSGVCTHEGNGYHTYAPAQAETNYDLIAFTFTGTGAVPRTREVYTRLATPAVDVTHFGGSAGTFASGRPEVNVSHFGGSAGTFASGVPAVNAAQISGDSTAADNLEQVYDATAGAVPVHGIVDRGTAQSATATTLVLRSGAAFADDLLIGATILITGGSAGVGQRRLITDYVSSTDTATVSTWTVTPTGTITYEIFATVAPEGTAQTGDAYARLGSPAGASVSADIAAVKVDTTAILVDTGTTLDGKLDTIDNNVDAILVDTGTTLQAELDGIQADTENIQSRLPAALTGDGNIKADALAIAGITLDPSSGTGGQGVGGV